ncbi:MAG: DNA primase [Leptospiraceae bacterium]|nr:DNA primase [Leptospiraceae bacterium]MCP5495781.1 DNA primase [Leptospiraceae bacterium]
MQIDRSFIDRIKREVSLEGYISRFTKIERRGKRYFALCPFHNEKTPSFTISPELQLYHCFGCGKSGDLFKFVMEYERVDFNRAREILSEYSGIPVYTKISGADKLYEEKQELYHFNQIACEYFVESLNSDYGKSARKYLQDRGLSSFEIQNFKIGYALPGFNSFIDKFGNNPKQQEMALKLGLIKESSNQKGNYYDFYRNRVMFPILDLKNHIVGFGGRLLGESNEAKYINSPSSIIYDKGGMFYNLPNAIESIRKTRVAILVEGYMDVIGLFSKRFENVVAPLGTSLTQAQIRMIKNYADKMVIMLDGDNAGKKAAVRACEVCLKEGLNAEVVLLSEGIDPYDLSQSKSKHEIDEILLNALPLSKFLLSETMEYANKQSIPEKKKKALEKLFSLVKEMGSETDKQSYLIEGAKILGLEESAVLKDFSKGEYHSIAVSQKYNPSPKILDKKIKPSKEVLCERYIIAKVILYNEFFKYADKIWELEFQDSENAFLWEYIYTKFVNGEPVTPDIASSSELSDSTMENLIPLLIEEKEINLQTSNLESLESIFIGLIQQHRISIYEKKIQKIKLKTELSNDEKHNQIKSLKEIIDKLKKTF